MLKAVLIMQGESSQILFHMVKKKESFENRNYYFEFCYINLYGSYFFAS
jgi:hypothetical protein